MRFQNVCVESLGYCLPAERITSETIEQRLRPLYRRLRLPEGRLELMTGIRERRIWPAGTLPSDKSWKSCEFALQAADFDRHAIGALIHGSVCRDHLEPATASRVHHLVDLSPNCMICDVSNACLGLLNGMLQVANMIELGQIRAGLVVGTESSRPLMATTIEMLNANESLDRRQIKPAIASLTIGSASCAVLLTHTRHSKTRNRLVSAVCRANTLHHQLCQSGADEAVASGMQPLMETDAERLLEAGVATGAATFETFLGDSGWSRNHIDTTICHQVGSAHQTRMLDALGLDMQKDFCTFPWLGNTGSSALPITLALAAEDRQLQTGHQVALLGIGSGINAVMLGVSWNQSCVQGEDERKGKEVSLA